MRSTLARTNVLAGVLLVILCTMTLLSGVSQQWFEWARAPELYASQLQHDATWLRAIIAVDDLFILAYVSASLLLAERLQPRWTPQTLLLAGGALAAGVLDLHENHQLLALLHQAEPGGEISPEVIADRSTWSQLKWLLGHLAFVSAGLAMRARSPLARVLQAALLGVQPVLGTLCWTVTAEPWPSLLVWSRYGAFVSGFLLFAWLYRDPETENDAEFV
ncbi:MAG: hypothetical protein AAGE52_20170 [Myxococcota bacterium]